jgi:hypothetical protein
LLAGCAAGFDATAIKPYAPSDGIQVDNGDLRLQNILVVANAAGTSGVVSGAIANRGSADDQLTGITSPDGQVDFTGSGDLPAGSALTLGAGSETSATLSGLTKLAGEAITLRFTFRRADPVSVETVVVPATGEYASITPAPTVSE